jgi:hypothetical protein
LEQELTLEERRQTAPMAGNGDALLGPDHSPVFVSEHRHRNLLVRAGAAGFAGLFLAWVLALVTGVSGFGVFPGLEDGVGERDGASGADAPAAAGGSAAGAAAGGEADGRAADARRADRPTAGGARLTGGQRTTTTGSESPARERTADPAPQGGGTTTGPGGASLTSPGRGSPTEDPSGGRGAPDTTPSGNTVPSGGNGRGQGQPE